MGFLNALHLYPGDKLKDNQLSSIDLQEREDFDQRLYTAIGCPYTKYWHAIMKADLDITKRVRDLIEERAKRLDLSEGEQRDMENVVSGLLYGTFRYRKKNKLRDYLFRVLCHDDSVGFGQLFRYFFKSELGDNPKVLEILKELHLEVKAIVEEHRLIH